MSLIHPTVAAWAVAIATLAGLVHGYSGFGGAFPLLAAVWAGSRLFERLPKQNYRRAILLLLFVRRARRRC